MNHCALRADFDSGYPGIAWKKMRRRRFIAFKTGCMLEDAYPQEIGKNQPLRDRAAFRASSS